MSISVFAVATALGQSKEFFQFQCKHFSVTNQTIETWNSKTERDFELKLLHRYTDNVETAPSDGLSISMRNAVMDIMDLIIHKSNSGSLSMDKAVTEAEFANAFPSHTTTFEGLIPDSDNAVWPQIVTVATAAESIIIYLYPPKFEVVYPNSNVEVISLLDRVDDFGVITLSSINRVIAELDALPFGTKFQKITSKKPCTSLELAHHQWVNRANLSESTQIPFGLVCYGNPSEESKDKAIRDFIDKNSSLGKSDKETIFPTLYGNCGFNIFPFWDNVALTDVRVIYSPIGDSAEMINFIDNHIPNLNGEHVDKAHELFPTMFQSLLCMVIPDEDEYATIGKLKDNIGKYILVAPLDDNFISMDSDTQEFVRTLFEALATAETFPTASPVTGIEIESIGELTYVTFFNGGLRWRILTKKSYLDLKAKG